MGASVHTAQPKSSDKRIDRLRSEIQVLKDKLVGLRKERNSLEKALKWSRRLLSDVPSALVLLRQMRVVYVNEIFSALLGYAEDELMDREFIEFVHLRSREEIQKQYQKWRSRKPLPDPCEIHLVTKNGDAVCCEVRANRTQFEGRSAFLLNVVGLDQKKEAERKSAQSWKAEALFQMSYGLNHELKKHIGLLDESVQSFRAESSEGITEEENWQDGIRSATEMVRLLTHQMECLTRKDNDSSELELIDLKKKVQDAVAAVKDQLERSDDQLKDKISIRTYLRSLSPVWATVEDMETTFANVISNAIESMPEGGEVYLTTEESSGFGHVYIQDSGGGIPEGIRDRIFDPFFTTKGSERSGLGLTLAEAAVRRNGGEIEVLSHEGQGSTFIVKLPIAHNVRAAKLKRSGIWIKDSHVLVIANEDVIKDLLIHMLAAKGSQVVGVSSTAEGLRLLKRKAFNLAIVSLEGPPHSHPDLIAKIKGAGRGLPVVVVGGEGNAKGFPHTPEQLGVDAVIPRPLNMDEVLPLVSQLLER
jgi:PAS domain S-box-containing protein